jgi:hypothetical protein
MANVILKSLLKREQSAYKARVRPLLCTLAVSLLVGAGCFNPNVKNGGFTCTGPGDGQCPSGYFCVNGFCLDSATGVGGGGGGGSGGPDLSRSSSQDLSSVTVDLAMSQSIDMAQAGNMVDMARQPADMTSSTGNNCAHSYCIAGTKLTASCDPCVQTICAMYSNCCNKTWSSLCVGDVNNLCGGTAHCP